MSLLEQVKQLRDRRLRAFEESKEMVLALNKREEGQQEFAADEQEKFDRIHEDIDGLLKQIENLERQMDVEAQMAASQGRAVPVEPSGNDPIEDPKPRALDFNTSLKRWGADGSELLTPEERKFLRVSKHRKGSVIELSLGKRAQSSGTDSEGGYTVPEGWQALERALLAFGGVRAAARVVRTATGEKLHIPTVNDTTNTGAILAENAEVDELDVVFSEIQLDAYKYTSKAVRVPHELMNDSLFDLASLLGSLLGERIGRITNTHFTTGSGSGQPNGIVTGAADSTVTAAATGAVTFVEMIQLKHSIDPSYRSSPSFGFMFNDSTLSALKQVSIGSADARPLWQPGVAVGAPDTVDGSRYWINQDMASMAASAKFALCGDFSNYWIRDVESVRLLRLDERYAEFDQVAFIMFSRHDADVINAGTGPIKWIDNAAS